MKGSALTTHGRTTAGLWRAAAQNSGQLWATAAWCDNIDAELASFVEMGFAVRWFLLGDGTTYGTGADRPQLVPGSHRNGDRDPPRCRPASSRTPATSFALRHIRAAALPSLVDLSAFLALLVAGSEGILKAGRSALIIDPRVARAVLDQTLALL